MYNLNKNRPVCESIQTKGTQYNFRIKFILPNESYRIKNMNLLLMVSLFGIISEFTLAYLKRFSINAEDLDKSS